MKSSFLSHRGVLLAFAVFLAGFPAIARADARVDGIRRRGFVTCGVDADKGVTGFAERDVRGKYQGFDVDLCRALSAAIFGVPDKVQFVQASSVAVFRRTPTIDVVSRRLTWELRREAPLGFLFGPITFFDGQSFVVAKRLGAVSAAQLSGIPVCVAGGTPFEFNVTAFFVEHRLTMNKVTLESPDAFDEIARALDSNRCAAYSADVSELGAIRARTARPGDYDILPDHLTQEPLAQLVRQSDPQLFDILRWTVFALIEAERLGVTAENVDAMRKSANVDVQRLLGVVPGNGKALGLAEAWAYNVIKSIGNYGEMFERNVGRGSQAALDRGLNRLWTQGGLLYAPPLR